MPDWLTGGGKQPDGSPKNVPITAIAPPWSANMVSTFAPRDAPGQLDLIGKQLEAGGFGTSKTNNDWMRQFYHDAPSAYFAPPVAPTAAPVVPPKPGVPVVPKTGGPMQPPAKRKVALGRNAR